MNTLTQRHRAQQLLLRRDTMAKVDKIWPALDWSRLDATYPDLAVLASRLVAANRQTSAGLTASYLRQFRAAERASGRPRIVLAAAVDAEQLGVSLRVSSVVSLKKAAAAGTAADVAMTNALTLTRMSVARHVLNGGRETLTQSIAADPAAVGYARVLGGSGCDFCRLLAGRGAVNGEESVQFQAHDRCGCTGEPIFN